MSSPAWLMQPPWLPVDAPLKGDEDDRSAHLLVDVARQFEVETAPRYAPMGQRTWCKTYLWDVLTALGCCDVAAHWVDRAGTPMRPGAPGAMETRANDVVMRLGRQLYGWRQADEAAAYAHADAGRPAVAGWYNRAGPGHVALVLPGRVIAQAGSTNFLGRPVAAGFGAKPVSFFTHD